MRCLRRVVRFDPATICLALTFVFLSAAGAVAQTAPVPLVADAGPDQPTVVSGTEVQLDGTGSTESESDGSRSVTYLWTRASGSAGGTGSPVTLSDTRVLQPTFTAPTLILGADSLTRGADSVTYIFTLTVTDDQGSAQATDMVTITVTARPVAVTGFDQKVPPGWPVVLDGFRSAAPAGRAIIKYTWFSVEVAPECDEAPKHTIEGSQARFTAEDLAPGAADVTYCFFLQVEQSNGNKSSVVGPLKVTVTNRESPYVPPVAMITGGDRVVASGGTVTLDGRHSTIDYRTWGRYRWERTDGTSTATGILTGETFRTASFTAETRDAGAPDVTHIFTLTVTDYQGGSSTATVTITVTAALVANAGPDQEFHSGGTVTLDGSGSTASGGGRNVTYAWTRASGSAGGTGSAVNLSDTTVVDPTFTTQTLNPGDVHVTYIFTLTVTDSANETDTDTVTITVFSVPANPVAQAGDDVSVGSGRTVTLDGSRSTVDYRRDRSTLAGKLTGSPPLFYSWARTGGTSTATGTLTGEDTATPRFTAETLTDGAEDVTHILTLTVTDGLAVTATDTVTITVTSALVANAGTDQDNVASGATVQLDGSGSTASGGGKNVTYAWTQTGGATVTLSNTTVLDPTFTAQTLNPGDASVTYIFTLTVTDSANESDTDTVTITVLAPLVAEAGPDKTVASGGTVTLDGSGSTETVGVRNVVYAWARTGGTGDDTVAPSNPVALQTSFTAEVLTPGAAPVIHEFTLTVADNQGSTQATDTVEITVTSGFVAPDAKIAGGDREVASGGTVDLDGSGSTHDGRTSLTYAWTRADGTTDGLTDPNTATPVFTAETLADGAPDVTHTLTLTVTDGANVSDTATVEITVTSGFVAPDAIIAGGNREVGSGGTVDLDGSGSTHDGRTSLTYAWTRADGTTDGLTDPNTATPVFTAETLADGAPDVTHTLTLTVTDGANVSDTATVEITVTSGFVAPDAIIAGGNREVGSGGTVDLDGSGSTHDGRTSLTYAWTRADGTTDGLTDPNTAMPVFTAETLADGAPDVTHTLTLTVTDGANVSDTATVEITVTSGFVAPDAIIAGGNREVGSGGTVDLDGSGSTHDGRTSLTYAWTRADGTTDGLTDPNTATPVFTAETLADGAPDVTHTLTLTVTDGEGVTDAATVEITVTSGFVAPDAIIAGGNREVGSGRTVDLDGSGSTHDGRTSLTYAWTRADGTTDGLTDPNTATPVFTAETLADGAPDVTHTLTLTVTDGANVSDTATVEITVTSGFVAPDAIIAGGNREVGSGGTVDLDGSGSTHDGRTSLTYAWTRADGTTDGLTDPNTATPVFTAETLADGAPDVTHTLTLTVTDGANVSDTATVEITVTSGFVAPDAIIAGGNREVGSGGTVDLDGSGSTHDGRTSLTYAWTRADGTTDGLTDPNTATPVFTAETLADGAPDVTHTLTLTVTDGANVSDTATVEITVTSGFVAPDAIIAGGNREVGSGGTVDLDGSGSTHDGRTSLTYAWTRADGTTDGLTDPNTATPVFTAETLADGAPDVTHTLTLTVTDGANVSDTATVEITVTSGFVAPDAIIAGGNREVGSGGTVDLDGSGSTHDGRTSLTYAWTRADGTTDGLTDPNTATPVFTAETLADGAPDVTHTLTLTVTDGAGVTDAATVEITVTSGFVAPDAIIAGGNREVGSGRTVDLDGSGSTHDGRTSLTYAWTRADGTTDGLTDPNTATPVFTAETLADGAPDVTHTLTLTVTDGANVSDTATVEITVTSGFVAPDAIIAGGNREVGSGGTVDLDGSGSTHDGRTSLTYAWTRADGTTDGLTDPNTATPVFTAETLADGAPDVTHTLTLTVTDGANVSDTATVEITVTSGFVAPDAIIAGGNREVGSGGTVDLDGSGSTHDGRTSLTYAWTRADGTTDGLTDPNTATPVFTAETLADGAPDVTHTLTLTVTDGANVSDTATVEITVTSGFVAPDAIIAGGNREVGSGGTVDLDGSGSTHDGRTSLTYAWTRADGTTDGLTDPNTATPVFTAETLADGAPDVTHTLTLTVTDGANVSDTATVEITVTSGFVAPDAIIAGGNREVGSGGTVDLDGSGSTHDGRTSLTYAWTRADGTTDGLTDPNTATPVFTAETLADGAPDVTHTLTLTVTDGANVSDTATVEITVTSGFVAPDAIIAGGNREVGSGGTVDLDGSGSTHDGRTSLTYAWTRADGTTDGLTDPNTATPVFTAETLADGAPDVTHTLTLTVTDGANVSDTATVEITVTSGFVAPDAIIAGGNREVGSGGTVDLDGSGSTHDGRTSLTYAWTRADGTTDGLTDPNTATPVFTAETLADGAPDVTHTLTLTVTDGANVSDTATVEITVTSGFVAPDAIIAGGNREVGSGGTVDLDGSGSTHDGRTSLTYAWTRADGTTDGLTDPNTATPVFTAETLADGAPDVTHTLTLTVTDGEGVTDTATVEITVTSGFVAPDAIIAGGNREVGSGGTVQLDGSGSTHDGRTSLTYAWTRADGTTDGLTDPNTATPVFTAETLADGAPDVTHTLTLTVTDGAGVTDAATVEITVTSGFVAPDAIIAGGNREVGSGGTVDLDGSGSTHDGRTSLTYAWTRADGTTDGLTDPNTATPVFTAETLADGAPDVTHTLTLTVTDGANVSDTATVEITVTSGFVAPDAIIAGGNREVGSGGTVDLDGSGSTHDGRTSLTYAWTRADGTTDGLTDPNTATPVFTAETLADGAPDVTHTLTLTVTDGEGVTDAATVEITVTSGFVAPDAIIAGGNREVGSGRTVDLDGSGSTHDARTSLTYAWTRADGTTDGLTDPNTATPVFTAETLADGAPDVTHTLTLTVTDGANVSDTATVEITVTSGFVAPDAIIAGGNREVGFGRTVDLDGSGSTHDARTSLTYAWTRADGTTDGLTDPNTATPVFTAETLADGAPDVTHTLTLTVTDGANVSDTATVEITVTSGFVAPDAIIAGGNREVGSGGTVDLDGSGSTHDARTSLTYAWTRADGTTDGLTDPNTATPVFTAETLADGAPDVTHTLTLTVTDGAGVTDAATVEITVTSGFVAPDAIIAGGNREVGSGGTVQLDGSGSTHDARTTLTYAWTRTDGNGNAGVVLTGEDTARLSFTADALTDGAPDVTHEFTLTVTDNQGGRSTATVTITVEAPPLGPPVAEAGDARSVVSGTLGVQLDGTGSTLTGGGRAVTYLWDRTGGDGATVTLTDADTLQPSFTAQTLAPGDAAVTYIFTLTVTDDQSSAAATDTVTITVVPVDTLDSPFELIGVSPLLFGLIVSAVDILVSTSELTVQEGGSSAYQVRLSESPGQDVTVTAVSDNENVVLENAQLTFNANNWDAWQEIRIGTVAGSENADGKTLIEHRLDTGGVALRQSGVVSVTVREEDPVLRPVGENLTARATTLLNNLPNLSSFLKQDRTTPGGSGGFTFKATNGHLALDGGFVRDGVWGEIAGSYTKSDFGDTRFVLGSFGIHRKYSERFLAGAMLQIDLADHDLDGKSGSIDSTGWLVGPYFAARHGTWPLYFEGRLLYGQSDNDIRYNDSGLGEKMRMGSFDTMRMLAQLRLEGEIALSDGDEGPRLIPYADTHWFEDRAAAFTDSIGTRISGQTVSISQLELGSNVEVPIAMSHGALTFTGGLGLVYSKTEGDYIPSVSRSRGRGEIGFSYGLDDNVRIDFESFYDGIGTSGYEGYGLSLNAEIKF